ncbi:MAG: DUF4097 family beta strand repeat protein [Actinobacteria bacterium]|nr:DUF4097 family beta strand repeat protein [Actinomycetota bacterium]
MTNLTPPDPATEPLAAAQPAHDPAAPPSPTQPSPRPARGALTAITIAAAILGGGALVVAGGTAAFAAVNQVVHGNGSVASSTTADVAGVTGLKVEVGYGNATIRFADVETATLTATGQGSGDWTMRRSGEVLQVQRPTGPFGWWMGGWFGSDPQMTLTLPRDLEGHLTAALSLDAGSLSAQGRFDTLSATVSAGELTVDGGASSVTTRVSAGSATLRLEDVTTADLSMSAGDMSATISGSQPDLVRLDVSAGSMDVTVPSGRYDLSKDTSAGSIDAQIRTDPSSTHRIQSTLSAGSITLREGS